MRKRQLIKDLYLRPRIFWLWGTLVVGFTLSFYFKGIYPVSFAALMIVMVLFLFDYILLFLTSSALKVRREMDEIFSNTDENIIYLHLHNGYALRLNVSIVDEVPVQFQNRNFRMQTTLGVREDKRMKYTLRPTSRGEYYFGYTYLYASTLLGLVERRFTATNETMVKVYPSFLQLRKYGLKGLIRPSSPAGHRKIRKGASLEFDQIKEYIRGDDVRTINWKATARQSRFMVNVYQDEKSQQIYCLIDKSRLMKMPFQGVTLLDYAINSALHFAFIALHKEDKMGLITFSNTVDVVVKASKQRKQFSALVETLYRQETDFKESDYARLLYAVQKEVGQRSLMFLYTNFESYVGFERKLPYFQMLSKKHLLCVIIFENTEIKIIHETRGRELEDIYIKTMADKYVYEKKMMLKELRKNGILSIFCAPEELSVQVVNKYLDLKTKRFL